MTKNSRSLPDYTFGCEIECFGPTSQYEIRDALVNAGLRAMRESDRGYGVYDNEIWAVGSDCSIDAPGSARAFEIKSPILKGIEGLRAIRKACAVFRGLNLNVNKTCGLHVHVGIKNAANQFQVDEILEILRRYNDHKSKIDLLLAKSRRSGENEFCVDVDEAIESIEAAIEDNGDYLSLNDLSGYGEHYDAVSVEALSKYGTLEFRQHHGTVSGKKITNWIKFLLNHVEMARKIVKAKKTPAKKAWKPDDIFNGQPKAVRKHFMEQAKRINGESFRPDLVISSHLV
jgi:hypothetical protein